MRQPILASPIYRNPLFLPTAPAQQVNASECVSVSVRDGKVCLDLPVVGSICLPIPIPVPSGTAAQACIDVCTHMGIPTGACVNVSVLGQKVAQQCFGWC